MASASRSFCRMLATKLRSASCRVRRGGGPPTVDLDVAAIAALGRPALLALVESG